MPGRVRFAAACLLALAAAPASAADTLRGLAAGAGLRVGTAVDVAPLHDDPAYARLVAREFDLVTPENAMKFSVIQPERGRFDFAQADALVEFAAAHGMAVNGHVLVWHQQLPAWLEHGSFGRDELIAILREHIRTLVTRYRGRVASWDVAAEAVDENGRMRETFWSRGIGPDYLALAFRWAHAADPAAELRYNDYGGEGLGAKSDGIYLLVAALRTAGAPVHGVGLQMHVSLDHAPQPAEVRANMQRLAALGLAAHITEMDVQLTLPATRSALHKQAALYRDMLRACLDVPACRSFSTWGATDRYSWIPAFFPGKGAALLFDAEGRPKPAYTRVRNTLRDAEPR
ncbi:MAG: endo-1,4-beta-xylanase [Pseudomonadota bacterium]